MLCRGGLVVVAGRVTSSARLRRADGFECTSLYRSCIRFYVGPTPFNSWDMIRTCIEQYTTAQNTEQPPRYNNAIQAI